MKTTSRKRQGFTLVELLVVIAIIATLAGVGVPVLLGKKKEGDKAQATLNAKQIGMAMFSFDGDYGEFPSDKTEATITTDNSSAIFSSATGSNKYLSQLFAGGYIDQEKPFFAKGPICRKEGDNNITDASNRLKAAENGFGYVMKSATESLNSSMVSNLPLLVAPNAAGTDGKKFDLDTYNKKAIVLSIDMSVSAQTIKTDGSIKLLETGTGTPWETTGLTPTVLAPAL